jgi:hypothetical protein
MIDVILQILVDLIISPVGGFIRWIIYRKKSLREYVDDDYQNNLGAVMVLIAILAVIVVLIVNL